MRYLTAIFLLCAVLAATGCRHADDPDIYRPEQPANYIPTDYE